MFIPIVIADFNAMPFGITVGQFDLYCDISLQWCEADRLRQPKNMIISNTRFQYQYQKSRKQIKYVGLDGKHMSIYVRKKILYSEVVTSTRNIFL